MNKKRIIMIAVAGLISFAGAFALAWLTKTVPQETVKQPDNEMVNPPTVGAGTMTTIGPSSTPIRRPSQTTRCTR